MLISEKLMHLWDVYTEDLNYLLQHVVYIYIVSVYGPDLIEYF